MSNSILIASFLIVFLSIPLALRWNQIGLAAVLVGYPFFTYAMRGLGLDRGFTIASASLMVFSAILYIDHERIRLTPRFAEIGIFTIIAYFSLTLIYTPAPNYGLDKVIILGSVILPLIVCSRVFSSSRVSLHNLLWWCGVYSIFASWLFAMIFLIHGNQLSRYNRFNADFGPLALGYQLVLSISFATYLLYDTRLITRLLALATIVMALIITIATGSRGPLVAIIVSTTLTYFNIRKSFQSLVTLGLIGGIAVGCALFMLNETPIDRLLGRRRLGVDSAMGRTYLFSAATRQFSESPILGGGVGAFATYFFKTDERNYPHNIVMELAAESGLIGLTVFGVVLFLAFKTLRRFQHQEINPALRKTLHLLFYTGLISSMFSFDFPKHRGLFVILGILSGVNAWSGDRSFRSKK